MCWLEFFFFSIESKKSLSQKLQLTLDPSQALVSEEIIYKVFTSGENHLLSFVCTNQSVQESLKLELHCGAVKHDQILAGLAKGKPNF